MPFRGKSIHPFCNKVKQDPLQTECTDDRSSVALCNLVKHQQPLPKKYQVGDHRDLISRKYLKTFYARASAHLKT